MSDKDQKLIQKIQETLGTQEDDLLKLLKLLRIKKGSEHPDKYTDDTDKQAAQKRFFEYSELYKQLHSCIQQHQTSSMPVLTDDNTIKEYEHIMEMDAKDNEITILNKKYSNLQSQLEQVEKENDKMHKQIEEVSTERIDTNHNKIRAIYSPRKTWARIGLVAILSTLLVSFPVVSDFLLRFGASSHIVNISIWLLSIITIFNWIRAWFLEKVIENTESSILIDHNINDLFNLKFISSNDGSKCYYFFLEQDIVSFLKSKLNRYRLLFIGGYSKTIKLLTEGIIYQLNRKHLIKDIKSNGLNMIYIVSSDVP